MKGFSNVAKLKKVTQSTGMKAVIDYKREKLLGIL